MLNRSPAPPDPAAASALPSLGDLDYRVQGLLPTDSKMSEILLATDRRQRTVILKIACVQQRARAETNRRAIHNSVAWLQGLRDHTGIAQMQPIGRKGQRGPHTWFKPPTFVGTLPNWPDNPDFLITEYLAGGTLNVFVGKRGLPLDLALGLAYDLAQTLAYLHAHDCVHRDLKPENILFREPPILTAKPGTIQPVLIDFGVAARIGEAKLIAGSRLWMAPELHEAHEKAPLPVDPAWDVYALGLICCYLLTGLRPLRRQYVYQDYIDYRAQVFERLRQAAASADAPSQQVMTALQQILARTLAHDPRQRPTAIEFATALATLLDQVGLVLPLRAAGIRAKVNLRLPRLHFRLPGLSMRWVLGGMAILLVVILSFLLQRVDRDQTMQELSSASAQRTAVVATVAVQPAASPVQNNASAVRLAVVADQQALTQPPALVIMSTETLPPPTLAALPAMPTLAIPTLVPFTPTALPTATPPPPTVTATPSPTRPLPTATATIPATSTRQPTPALDPIRLGAPAAGVVSAQDRVEFSWQITRGALDADHCYELVFWDPAKVSDQRSPIGAGRAGQGAVTFSKLRASPDPLLRALADSPTGFDWGVRVVSCTDPRTILQTVSETRHYTYQP